MTLDEPTAALGVAQTGMVLSLIKRLASQGVAVIVVSHNLNDVFEVADRIVILHLGRMVAQGPVSEFDPASVVDYMTTGRSSREVDHTSVAALGRARGLMTPDESSSGAGTPSELEEPPLSNEQAEDETAAPESDSSWRRGARSCSPSRSASTCGHGGGGSGRARAVRCRSSPAWS